MGKSVEVESSRVDLAVEKALVELGVERDQVEVEVLEKGGLFQQAKVRVTIKQNDAVMLQNFFNGTLERMGLKARATAEERDATIYIEIHGEDSGVAIGYRGEALDALQYLALTLLNEQKGDFKKIVVDCEGYREKRRETLTELALRLAQKAHRIARKIELEPMNPFERRIVHSALADSTIAKTQSEGEDLHRHVVIIPIGVELKDERPIKNGQREDRNKKGYKSHNQQRGSKGRGRSDRDRTPRRPRDEEEVEDGRVYRGYYTAHEDFVKPSPQAGPPKFKSFGGKKKF